MRWTGIGFVLAWIWACGTVNDGAVSTGLAQADTPVPNQGLPEAASTPEPTPRRLVAVGDLHADLGAARDVLALAGLVDGDGSWIGGDATLVQTGDTTDRGPDGRTMLDWLRGLQQQATEAGGRVVLLMGNHEAMNLQGDWRYVHPDDVAGFGGADARRAALAPGSELGSWLRGLDAVAEVQETVFLHGGVSVSFAGRGVDVLARDVRAALEQGEAETAVPRVLGPEGPLWYRGYLQAEEPVACRELEQALTLLEASRMVVGHTTQRSGRIAHRCGGRLLGIDTGISTHYGRNLAALELTGGDARALYPGGVEDLPDP
ncbi:MAG: metallophosphoesterase [Myxococcota bacterium]|jgi:hypothetical protein|nr:metallophosphoesterase [Myxococcota bacterium]